MATSNHYTCLGLSESASVEDIKKAYRRLALKHHPDKSKAPDSVDKFKKLVDAYDTLSDPKKKLDYDKTLVTLTKIHTSYRPGASGSSHYNGFAGGSHEPSSSHYSGSRQWTPRFKSSKYQSERANNAESSFYANRGTKFSYEEEDEFDFLYKKNQTRYDSFSNSKNYFTSNIRSQQANQRPPSSGKGGSFFHRASAANTETSSHAARAAASAANAGAAAAGSTSTTSSNSTGAQGQRGYGFNPSHTQYSTNHNSRFRETNGNFSYTTNGAYFEPGFQRQSSVPPHKVQHPPTNGYRPPPPPPYYQYPPSASYTYTQASTSIPSVTSDPLPKSWQKQQTTFKNPPTTSQQPRSSSGSSSTTSNINKKKASPNPSAATNNYSIPIPSYSNNIGGGTRRPKTPPSNNGPLDSTTKDSSIDPTLRREQTPGLKFDIPNFKNASNKSTPQNIRTQKRAINKNGRRGIPTLYNSRSPSSKNASQFKKTNFPNASGRPSRTTLEEVNDIDFVMNDREDSLDDVFESVNEKFRTFGQDSVDDEHDDDIIEIDESTFDKIRAKSSDRFKKSKPNPKPSEPEPSQPSFSSLDFEGFNSTTPLTQTNGNFNMNDISDVLDESSEDVLNGKKIKKQKIHVDEDLTVDLTFEKLNIQQNVRNIKIPEELAVLEPQNLEEYEFYKQQFQKFQSTALDTKHKLSKYLNRRSISDEKFQENLFSSTINIELFEKALADDSYVHTKLAEINQALIKAMATYKKYREKFREIR